MQLNKFKCDYPCTDVIKDIIYPEVEINPEKIRIALISEAPPENRLDYYYESTTGSFFQTTKIAFQDAGLDVENYENLTEMGFYLTTAIKCCKVGYLVSTKTIKECAMRFLKTELEQLPNIRVIMCMGDFAIKAVNYIYKDKYGEKQSEQVQLTKYVMKNIFSIILAFFPLILRQEIVLTLNRARGE